MSGNVQRPGGDPYDYLLTMARQGCFCEGNRKPCERHDAYADGLEAGLAAADGTSPVPSVDDEQPDTGLSHSCMNPSACVTCLAADAHRVQPQPDELRALRELSDAASDGPLRRRPTPPPPAVERVPWWDAMTQELPIAEWGGQRIKHAKLQNSGMFLSTWGTYNVIRVDAADGTVEVLRQDGAE